MVQKAFGDEAIASKYFTNGIVTSKLAVNVLKT